MSLVMYDSVTISEIPPNPPAVAGYVDGTYRNYDELVAAFPNAHHLSIAVSVSGRARCLDVEPGDATAAEAAGWLKSAYVGPGVPVFYTSASVIGQLTAALAQAGIARSSYLVWSAHYTLEHICSPQTCGYPQADGTQWTDRALGRNLDQSVLSDAFFGPPPQPVDLHHYDWFASPTGPGLRGGPYKLGGLTLNERAIVTTYDRLRPHPLRHAHRLRQLRDHLGLLAARVESVAYEFPLPDGKPNWQPYHRGWRRRQLWQRAHGQRLA